MVPWARVTIGWVRSGRNTGIQVTIVGDPRPRSPPLVAMTHDPTTQRQAAPDAPPPGDSLRLVRLRLYLTIAAAAVLPLALGSPLVRILAGGPNGLQPDPGGGAGCARGPARRPDPVDDASDPEAGRGARGVPRSSPPGVRGGPRVRPRRWADRAREPPLVPGGVRVAPRPGASLSPRALAGAPGPRRVQAGERRPGSRRRRRAAGGGGAPPAAADPASRPRIPDRR